MFTVTLRGLQGHLVRLLLTASAVMLGVSFVAGTFVLRASIDNSVDGLLARATQGLDVSVRGVEVQADGEGTGDRPNVPLTLMDTLAALPGVAQVSPDLQGSAIIAGRDGTAVRTGGAPSLGLAYNADAPGFTLVSGRGPIDAGEVAIETATLTKAGLHVGDRTPAIIGGRTSVVTITGEVHFGALLGATAVFVDESTARKLFAPDGTVSGISLTSAEGVSDQTLRESVARVLPDTAEAVTGDTVRDENATAVQQQLGFLTTLLLVFAGIALFVGCFIIVNTFSMLVAQRARELALLRALGASRGQVVRTVLGEAAIVGFVGSVLGLGLGVLVAAGAKSAIRGLLGADVGTGLPVTATTVLTCLAVGTLVTMVAATLPARRAARTAPVAAMRGEMSLAPQGLRRRAMSGLAVLVVGALALAWAVTRDGTPWLLAGGGAVLGVLGMLVAAPAATRPVVRVVAWPFVMAVGLVGRLARQNALRVPRRTAATASALMIGLALVAGISVLASSVEASIQDGVANELTSDFVLNSGNTTPVPSTVAPAAAALPGVASVAAISQVTVRLDGFATSAFAVTASDVAENFDVTMAKGSLDALSGDDVLVDATTAAAHHWQIGDVLAGTIGTLADHPLTVGGIYEEGQAFESHVLVDRTLYFEAVPANLQTDGRVFVRAAPGADLEQLRAELVALVKPFLVVSVQDASEFANAQAASIDIVINLLYALLLFSVVIAVLGIINTLALSVLERTREIGMLRAIGLRRRQLSGMITIEAITTAVFGALLGTLLGLGLGVALQRGLQSQGLNTLGIPWLLVTVMMLASVVVGILAAALPSLRAVRLNILDAMSHV